MSPRSRRGSPARRPARRWSGSSEARSPARKGARRRPPTERAFRRRALGDRPRDVVEEAALDAVDDEHGRPRPFARGDAPAVLAVALELPRIADPVLLMSVGRAAAVLEVVAVLCPHEGVPDAAEVDPDVRELVNEERPRVEELLAVETAPAIGRGRMPRSSRGRERVGRRTQREQVEDQGLAVPAPAVAKEPALGSPAVSERAAAVRRPMASRPGGRAGRRCPGSRAPPCPLRRKYAAAASAPARRYAVSTVESSHFHARRPELMWRK